MLSRGGVVFSSSVLFLHAFPGYCLSPGPFSVKETFGLSQDMMHLISRLACPIFSLYTSNWNDLPYQHTRQIQIYFINRYTFFFPKSLFMFCIPPWTHSRPTLSIGIRSFFKCQTKKNKKIQIIH